MFELVKAGWLSPIRNPSAVIRLLWPLWLPVMVLCCLIVFFPAYIELVSNLSRKVGVFGFVALVFVTVVFANAIMATAIVNWHRFLVLGESDRWSTIVPTKAGWKYLGILWLLCLPMVLLNELSRYFIRDLLPWQVFSSINSDGSGLFFLDNSYYILMLIGEITWLFCMLLVLATTSRFWLKLPQIAVAGSPVIADRKLLPALLATVSLMTFINLMILAWKWAYLVPRVIYVAGNMIGFFMVVWGVIAFASVISLAYKDAKLRF